MPNQRHPDRRAVTCWVRVEIYDLLTQQAAEKRRSRTSLAEEILEKEVARREKISHATKHKNTH